MSEQNEDRFELEGTADAADLPQPGEPAKPGPRGLPAAQWEMIPDDLKPEALDRASWLVFRGESLEDALVVASDGMREDMDEVDFEPAWDTVRLVAAAWPLHARGEDGRYRREIMHAASAVEAAAVGRVYGAMTEQEAEAMISALVDEETLPDCLAILSKRCDILGQMLLAEQQSLPNGEDLDTNSLDSWDSI